MSISERIDGLLEQHSLLKHPFYQAWSDGKLEMESLAGYSKEYYQLVKAVPEFMNPLIEMAPEGARVELEENRMEESEHIELWENFASSIGVDSHDDIIDNEKQRRMQEPFHIKYGQNKSILTGDFVLGLILNIASRLDNPRITKDLAIAAMQMSEGEAMEERLESEQDVTFDDYLKVIEYKTAAVFEAAAKIGAVISGGSSTHVEALTSFGKNIGIAYQIRDDLLDWKNEDKIFNTLIKKSKDPRDVFDKMEELLKNYSSNARIELSKLPESHARRKLETLVEFTMFKA